MQPRREPRTAFRDQFAALVTASGLSIRRIEKRTRVPKSTLDGWKNGKTLPHDRVQLLQVVHVLRAAAGDTSSSQVAERTWTVLLREAKEARDAHSARRPAGSVPRNPELDIERRARSIAATSSAKTAFMRLRNLDTKPDWRREVASYSGKDIPPPTADEKAAAETWEQQREDLLAEIELAILDIDDDQLRTRLKEAIKMVQLSSGPMRHIRQSESRTRWIAASDALEALGAYRRGDPPPDQSAEYLNTREFVELYLEEMEMNAGN